MSAAGQVDLSKYGSVELGKYGDVEAAEKPGTVSRFLEPLNPMPLVHALFRPAEDPKEPMEMTFARNVAHVVKGMGLAQLDQGKKALDAWDQGDHTSAVAHGMAALTPILGPISQQAADKFIEGDIAGGMGSLTSMALPEILHQVPKVAGAVKGGVGAVAEAATKPGTGKVMVGAGQLAGAPAALATGHPIVAGGLAVRGLDNLRKGLAERAVVPPPTIPPLWDELAGPGGYAKLGPAEQAMVQKIAERMSGPAPAEAAVPQAPRDLSHYGVVEQTPSAAEVAQPGPSPSPAAPAIEAPPPVAPPVVAEPVAPTEPTVTPKRTTRGDAQTLTNKLLDWKMTPDEVDAMNEKGWIKLAFQSGVPLPSAAVRESATMGLRRSLAGPPVTIADLIERFHKGKPTPAAPSTQEPASALAANPKALAAAQALNDAMQDSTTVGDLMKRTPLEREPVAAREVATKQPKATAEMAGAEINKELDRLSKESSQINKEFIDTGRGSERPSDRTGLTDPLTERWRINSGRTMDLQNEIAQRYGPGAPARLPPGGSRKPRAKPTKISDMMKGEQ